MRERYEYIGNGFDDPDQRDRATHFVWRNTEANVENRHHLVSEKVWIIYSIVLDFQNK